MKTGRACRKSVLKWAVLVMVSVVFAVSSHAATRSPDGRAGPPDFKRVEGKWQRPDGRYVLELKDAGKDGSVEAAYFNPRPINVARATVKPRDGMVTVFVELRDVNYPGWKNNLQYDPRQNRLIGTYFQAVEKQTYNIAPHEGKKIRYIMITLSMGQELVDGLP